MPQHRHRVPPGLSDHKWLWSLFANPYFVFYFVALLRLPYGPFCLGWTRPVGHLQAELTSSTPRASYNIGVPSFEARARPAALFGGPRLRAVLPSTARIAPGHPLPRGTAQHRAASHNIAPHHRMLIHGEACRHMPVSASTCQCMLAHIGTCPCEPRHACDAPGGVHRAACTERRAERCVACGSERCAEQCAACCAEQHEWSLSHSCLCHSAILVPLCQSLAVGVRPRDTGLS